MTRGRIAKPETRFVRRAIRAPRELWARLDAAKPPRERCKFIREALDTALKQQAADAAPKPPPPSE